MHYVKICDYYEDSIVRQHFAWIWIIYSDHRPWQGPLAPISCWRNPFRLQLSHLARNSSSWEMTHYCKEHFNLGNCQAKAKLSWSIITWCWCGVAGWVDIVCMLEHSTLDSCCRLKDYQENIWHSNSHSPSVLPNLVYSPPTDELPRKRALWLQHSQGVP